MQDLLLNETKLYVGILRGQRKRSLFNNKCGLLRLIATLSQKFDCMTTDNSQLSTDTTEH